MPKSAFSVHNRRFMYLTVPMGISNAPSTLARLLNMVFSGLEDNLLIYLDDFVLHAESLEEHKTLLREIFSRLSKAKLQISIEKCSFFCDSVNFLGFNQFEP